MCALLCHTQPATSICFFNQTQGQQTFFFGVALAIHSHHSALLLQAHWVIAADFTSRWSKLSLTFTAALQNCNNIMRVN